MNGDSESGTSAECSNSNRPALEPYKDEELLRELYHDEGLSQYQIANRFDITQQTVSYWMDKLGIDARPPMDEREKSIARSVDEDAKILYQVPDGEGGWFPFYRHQLVALLAEDEDGSWHVEDPFELISVMDNEVVVHHSMAFLSIDTPQNLEVMGQAEHVRGHAGGAIVHHPRVVLRELFREEPTEERKQAIRSKMWRRRFEQTAGESRFGESSGAVADD